MTDRIDERTSLDLLSLRYVAGELAPDEMLAFEATLAEDQVVRESVERVVRIGMAVAQEAAATAPMAPVATFRRGWIWALAASVVLGIGVAVGSGLFSGKPVGEPIAPARSAGNSGDGVDDPEVLASWAELADLREAGDATAAVDRDLDEGMLAGELAEVGAIPELVEVDDSLAAPSWMLEALSK